MVMMGTNSGGGDLLLRLDRTGPRPLRAQLEEELRGAIRDGRLAADSRLPPTRSLAADLGVSRRLVVDSYAQLLAEGYLTARAGAGTFVAGGAVSATAAPPAPAPRALRYDFFPGSPDLAGFPRRAWLRAQRTVLREAPDSALGYPDPRGAPELRRALAGHLRRVRGVAADESTVLVCAGAAQAVALLAGVLGAGAEVAVEDPGLPLHREILAAAGTVLAELPVDEHGARVEALERCYPAAVLVTPAHQSPTGSALAADRRAALLTWARSRETLVIEDDYDAEFRYDRQPLGALQGLAPDRVAYMGTVSKTLAPALRLGWLVLPEPLMGAVAEHKRLADAGSPTLEQLALARLIESGDYDRHLRQARRRYRARRDALVAAVARHLPGARVTGVAAGLHAIVRLPHAVDGLALMQAAASRSVGVYPLGFGYLRPRPLDDGLVLGYANLAEPAIEEGVRLLALALEGLASKPAAANEGGAIAR
ncbi:MAG TPA: PLP-dependent aminotransferase family protein [Solirubrobacteraceae bacterium]|nr:PLP-dependent aminotransferase family protein [Solirubrobacteraceae bacterium]